MSQLERSVIASGWACPGCCSELGLGKVGTVGDESEGHLQSGKGKRGRLGWKKELNWLGGVHPIVVSGHTVSPFSVTRPLLPMDWAALCCSWVIPSSQRVAPGLICSKPSKPCRDSSLMDLLGSASISATLEQGSTEINPTLREKLLLWGRLSL